MSDDATLNDNTTTDGQGGIADVTPPAGENPDAGGDTGGNAPGIADDDAGSEGDKGGEDAAKKPDDAPKPDTYELTAGDDFPMPEDNLKSFTETCKKAGLSKEQAEAVLGWHKAQYDTYMQQSAQSVKDTLAGWGKEIQGDPEFGGTHWKQTVADARKAFDAFDADGSLRAMLRETQYQHNPVIIRAVARIGRLMQEHGYIGSNGEGGKMAPLEERFWPDKQ